MMLTVSGYALPNSLRFPGTASVDAACMRILKLRVSRISISSMRITSGDHDVAAHVDSFESKGLKPGIILEPGETSKF
jgi:hypothetical protein